MSEIFSWWHVITIPLLLIFTMLGMRMALKKMRFYYLSFIVSAILFTGTSVSILKYALGKQEAYLLASLLGIGVYLILVEGAGLFAVKPLTLDELKPQREKFYYGGPK